MEKENKPTRGNDAARGGLWAAGGGYTVYMAYQMVRNTLSGASSMSLTTTAVLAAVLGLGGAAVAGFGFYIMYKDYKKSK